jgi:minor extracellular serine protease Vpr
MRNLWQILLIMRQIFLILTGLTCLSSIAQMSISNNCRADILTISKSFQRNQITGELIEKFPINEMNGIQYLSCLANTDNSFDENALDEYEIIVGAKINKIVSLKIPLAELGNIDALPGIAYLQIAQKIRPLLNKARYDTRVDSVHSGFDLPEAYSGKDILIGITDWGFDYTSPMFYDTLLEETRIYAAWDQFKTSGPSPADYPYGTEYTTPASLIAAGSDTANIYSYGTHGTHVAGIAGGSGAGTIFRGMAYEAEFLFTTFLVDEASVLDAWEWMYNKSIEADKRLVINMSWGLYHTGALDGTSLLSQAIDNYSAMGVLFVTSGGNNGDVDFHIKKAFFGDTLRSRVMFYYSPMETLYGQSIHAWGEPSQSFSAGFDILDVSNNVIDASPWFATELTDEYIDSFVVVAETTDTIWYNLSMDAAYPTNDRPQMRMRVKRSTGSYKIALKATSLEGTVHFWNVTELTSDVGNWGMDFVSLGAGYTAGDNLYGVGAPACTNSAISVAAHNPEFALPDDPVFGGGPASFSSLGPLMTEELKPDISGPGASIGSSISSFTDASYSPVFTISFEGRDYPFAKFSGTSMSGPAVAGIAALILDANPYLSPAQVKEIIIETAREDAYTGVIPATGDTKWGWGKIDAYKAIKTALVTSGLSEVKKELNWSVYPNPAKNQISLSGDEEQISEVQILGIDGRLYGTYTSTKNLSIAHLPTGVYICRVQFANKIEQQKFIIE